MSFWTNNQFSMVILWIAVACCKVQIVIKIIYVSVGYTNKQTHKQIDKHTTTHSTGWKTTWLLYIVCYIHHQIWAHASCCILFTNHETKIILIKWILYKNYLFAIIKWGLIYKILFPFQPFQQSKLRVIQWQLDKTGMSTMWYQSDTYCCDLYIALYLFKKQEMWCEKIWTKTMNAWKNS